MSNLVLLNKDVPTDIFSTSNKEEIYSSWNDLTHPRQLVVGDVVVKVRATNGTLPIYATATVVRITHDPEAISSKYDYVLVELATANRSSSFLIYYLLSDIDRSMPSLPIFKVKPKLNYLKGGIESDFKDRMMARQRKERSDKK